MGVLGISCHYHDAAACLYDDGRPVAAAEEERFTRRKHDAGFPREAIAYVLREAGLDPSDLEAVVFYEKPLLKFQRILTMTTDAFPGGVVQFVPAMGDWLSEKLWIGRTIRRSLEFRGPLYYSEHHLSHAASAFYSSPFEEAAVITMDAIGEWTSTAILHGRGLDLTMLREIRFPHSLGLLYSTFTAYLGFEVNEGEYKVMGMAAYGRPLYVDKVRRLIRLFDDGSYALDMSYFGYHRSLRAWGDKFVELFGPPCRPANSIAELDERCADIAASIQTVAEELVLGIAREAHRLTGASALCVSGGVAQNVLANRRLLLESPFKQVYVPSAPGDSGGALGAAAYIHHAVLRQPRRTPVLNAQLGPSFDEGEIGAFLAREGLPHRHVGAEQIADEVASLITDQKVVGWFQGRMEFGPRALGGRSVLASPSRPEMKDILNLKIKHREPFRPFAPSVPREHAGRFFEDVQDSPFMSFVAVVRPEARSVIPAVTHVDGTSRLQTVSADAQPLYYRLLEAVGRHSGVPVVVNTSFNVRGEPIVRTPEDAYRCFASTEMDALALGPYLVLADAKREVPAIRAPEAARADALVS